jgi:UDP-glucose 4-epimerase
MSGEPPTILVTGAAGLIGSAVARLLRERGSRVIACDDFSIGTWREEREGLVWEAGDVSDPQLLQRLAAHPVNAVVHAAAHPGGKSLQEPAENVRVNALGSMRLFDWCARAKIPVIYLSSSAVYGEQPAEPIREEAPLKPGTVYAVCKVACEQFLRILEAGYGLRWTVLRLFATYGAGHRPSAHQGIVNVMLTQLLAGDRLVVRGSLDRVRDLVYVDDAARAIVECLFNEATRGRILNVGTGVPVTIRELIAALCQTLGRRLSDVTMTEGEPTVGDPHYSVADVGALAHVGVVPRIGLAEGLERLLQARKERLAVA